MKNKKTSQGQLEFTVSRQKTKKRSVHFSSEKHDWATPKWLFDALKKEFPFDTDVASDDSNCLCEQHYTKKENGLLQDWGKGFCWCNPPYGRQIGSWVRKAYESAQAGATVVCLLPSRTDTKWWHTWVMKADVRYFLGRLKFSNSKSAAPFPSALVIFRPPTFSINTSPMKEPANL